MWQGILQGLTMVEEERERRDIREEARRTREEDMAFRREMFNAQILENRRVEALAIARARREEDRAIQQAINGAVGMGFDRRAAEALQSSGQLGFVMRSMEAQEFSPTRISAMSEEILRQLGDRATDETISNTVVGVVESGANLNNSRESALAIAEALLDAEGIEQVESLRRQIEDYDERETVEPFSISLGTGDVDTPELSRIRTNILQTISPFFGEIELVSTGDGNVVAQNAPRDFALLVNNMVDRAVQLSSRVGSDRLDTVSAVMEVTKPIVQLQAVAPELDVSNLNANFEQIYTVPTQTCLEQFAVPAPPPPPPPPGSGSSAADFMQGAGQTRRQAGGVRPATTPPPTGFAFDPNEEID